MNNDPENIMPVNSNVMEFSFFSEEECDDIKKYCHNVEKKLIDDGYNEDTGHESLGDVVTTVNYFRYNFFADNPQYAERLVNCLRKTNQYLDLYGIN